MMCTLAMRIALFGLLVMALAPQSLGATNTLTSVLSVDGSGGYWRCGYQGNISFTSPQSIARYVKVYVDGAFDGYASYLQRQGLESFIRLQPESVPNNWDYHGSSNTRYGSGSRHSVYTLAGVWNPSTGSSEVQSNTRYWTSGQ